MPKHRNSKGFLSSSLTGLTTGPNPSGASPCPPTPVVYDDDRDLKLLQDREGLEWLLLRFVTFGAAGLPKAIMVKAVARASGLSRRGINDLRQAYLSGTLSQRSTATKRRLMEKILNRRRALKHMVALAAGCLDISRRIEKFRGDPVGVMALPGDRDFALVMATLKRDKKLLPIPIKHTWADWQAYGEELFDDEAIIALGEILCQPENRDLFLASPLVERLLTNVISSSPEMRRRHSVLLQRVSEQLKLIDPKVVPYGTLVNLTTVRRYGDDPGSPPDEALARVCRLVQIRCVPFLQAKRTMCYSDYNLLDLGPEQAAEGYLLRVSENMTKRAFLFDDNPYLKGHVLGTCQFVYGDFPKLQKEWSDRVESGLKEVRKLIGVIK